MKSSHKENKQFHYKSSFVAAAAVIAGGRVLLKTGLKANTYLINFIKILIKFNTTHTHTENHKVSNNI